ncbi:MAG: hypothetical protein NTW29_19810 [Bacteroidetes bacterium]|nr:hypothetical protein [Bacteroidota bacterium]
MAKSPFQDTLDRLKKLMYGYNYQISLEIDLIEKCNTLEDVYAELKTIYKDIRPGEYEQISYTEAAFWEEINSGLDFRGDPTAGLILSPEKEKRLKEEQVKYKSLIKQFITEKTKIYYYPGKTGIPFYVVYWGYAFILLNEGMPSLFIYGAASD